MKTVVATIPRKAVADVFGRFATMADTERLGIAWAVPHSRHRPGRAALGSRTRERAFVADAGFVYVICCCGSTPFEIAEDLGIPREWLQPHAAEQARMIRLQEILRSDLQDPEARDLAAALGLSIQQVLMWRHSDAGWPPEAWTQEERVAHAA